MPKSNASVQTDVKAKEDNNSKELELLKKKVEELKKENNKLEK